LLTEVIFLNQGYPPLTGSIGCSPSFKLGDQTLNSFLTKLIFLNQGYHSLAGSNLELFLNQAYFS